MSASMRLWPRAACYYREGGEKLGIVFSRRASSLVVMAGVLAWSEPSRAGVSISDVIEADADPCLTQSALVDGTKRWLKRTEVAVPLRVVVRVSPEAQVRFDVLRSEEHVGERFVDGKSMSCETLRNVVTFAIAVSVEGALQASEDSDADSPSPDEEPLPELARPQGAAPELVRPPPADTPQAATNRSEPQSQPWAVSVEELVFIDGSKVPPLGAAADLERRLTPRLDARIGYLATTGTTLDVGPGVVRTWLSAGRLQVCWTAFEGRATLRGCAGGAAGALLGTGHEFHAVGRARLFWAALAVRAELELRLSNAWHLRLALSPTWAVHSATLLAEDARTGAAIARADAPRGALVVSSGLAYRF